MCPPSSPRQPRDRHARRTHGPGQLSGDGQALYPGRIGRPSPVLFGVCEFAGVGEGDYGCKLALQSLNPWDFMKRVVLVDSWVTRRMKALHFGLIPIAGWAPDSYGSIVALIFTVWNNETKLWLK